MTEEWKVYIKGVRGRGNEVVEVLEDLGGRDGYLYDGYLYTGKNEERIYYINHNGKIDYEYLNSEIAKIIMDNYKEIKLPEQWKDGDILYSDTDKEFAVFKDKWKLDSDKFLAYFATCHGGYLTLQAIRRRDFRLTTKLEVEQFYEYLHSIGKDWDAEKKQLVDWKWKPKKGERYWFIGGHGQIRSYVWNNDFADIDFFNFGNYFKTKEEAEAMAKKIKKLLNAES